MRSSKQLRTFLLLILLVIQCLSCIDLTHTGPLFMQTAAAEIETAAQNSTALSQAMPMPEELDSQHEPPIRRRMLLIANTLSISDPRSIETQERISSFVRTTDDTEAARITSWLDKERTHVEATKSEPLWLRFQSLLI